MTLLITCEAYLSITTKVVKIEIMVRIMKSL